MPMNVLHEAPSQSGILSASPAESRCSTTVSYESTPQIQNRLPGKNGVSNATIQVSRTPNEGTANLGIVYSHEHALCLCRLSAQHRNSIV
jgi:hypothetical protein